MSPVRTNCIFGVFLFFCCMSSAFHANATPQPDHLSSIEKLEAQKISGTITKRLQSSSGLSLTVDPTSPHDEAVACGFAHSNSRESAQQPAASSNEFAFRSADAEDDTAVDRIAMRFKKNPAIKSFRVASWPIRSTSSRGEYQIVIWIGGTMLTESDRKPSSVSSVCAENN